MTLRFSKFAEHKPEADTPAPGKRCLAVKMLIVLSVAANIGLALILFTPLAALMHRMLASGDEPIPNAQAIVVLSSVFPFPTPNGLPGLSTLVRLEKGLTLYRQGYAPKIIVLGGIWVEQSRKTIAQMMAERLATADVPPADVIVHDEILGGWEYYENLMHLISKYKNEFDFTRVIFVTSSEQSFRIRKCLEKKIEKPIIVLSEPYEQTADWGRRFHLFRRAANEMLVAIPLFYLTGRF